ncbi:MAG TPA: endolytic transglycosylase MltG [Bacteroidota bacterium]
MAELPQKYRRLLPYLPLFLLLAIAALLFYQIFWSSNDFPEPEKAVIIPQGATFLAITDSLEQHDVIRNRQLFVIAGKLTGWSKNLQKGKYSFERGISNYGILAGIYRGTLAVRIPVTIREGLTSERIARISTRDVGIDSAKFVELVHNPDFVHSLGIEAPSLEGYLLPDTYKFLWDPEEEEVIGRMVEEFKLFYTDSLQARAAEIGFDMNDVVTFASIVEGEAILDEERPIIAGVYHNRLRRRMRLEADPTIQYLLEGGPRRLLYQDLKIKSPYNTYQNYGLPPGPINNPGRSSVLATLYPARHSYLFFVTDGQGGHIFSKTYAEHLRAVRKYRRMMRERTLNQELSSGS